MNDITHPRPEVLSFLPLAVAAASLTSVLWLLLVSIGFGAIVNHNYKEEQRQRAYYPVSGGEKSQRAQVVSMIAYVTMLLSTLASLALIIVAFCFWPRHILVGKVLTIASAVLFIPFLCCGVFLGQL